MASINRFVQVCPHDGPPFLDLCRVYAKAARSLGLATTTVFLGPPRAEPAPADNHYLNAAKLRATHRLARALRNALVPGDDAAAKPHDALVARSAEACEEASPTREELGRKSGLGNSLVLCHRYRAYWLFVRSGLSAGKIVALAHEHGSFNRPGRRLRRLFFGRGVTLAGVSPTITDELRRISNAALHLPNALDLEAFEPLDRATARRELGLPVEGGCIGVVGRLHYKKNPALALKAFRLFIKRHGPAHLGFVGEGTMRRELQAAAAELPVTFTGFVNEPKRLMRAFDAVLLTSGAQAFPNLVALEAMAAGVPVVSPGLRDAISVLGSSGFYFDEADPESICSAMYEAVSAPSPSTGPERVREAFSVAAVARTLQQVLGPVQEWT